MGFYWKTYPLAAQYAMRQSVLYKAYVTDAQPPLPAADVVGGADAGAGGGAGPSSAAPPAAAPVTAAAVVAQLTPLFNNAKGTSQSVLLASEAQERRGRHERGEYGVDDGSGDSDGPDFYSGSDEYPSDG